MKFLAPGFGLEQNPVVVNIGRVGRSFSLLCVWLFGISENKHKTGTWVRKQNGKAYWKGRKAQTESTKGSEKDCCDFTWKIGLWLRIHTKAPIVFS